ncbi:MAG: hypothetical protein VX546_11555 [Myxococcota bacterium]|nr:hypothetical protein [Myxococcota bacterium]
MNFQSVLREIVEHCDGGIAAALMQSDGIPVEEVTVDPASLTEEIATAGAEFGRILEELRKAADAVGGGAVVETTVHLSRVALVLRVVDEDLFLVVALAPDGNLGKARYLIRKQLFALRQLL